MANIDQSYLQITIEKYETYVCPLLRGGGVVVNSYKYHWQEVSESNESQSKSIFSPPPHAPSKGNSGEFSREAVPPWLRNFIPLGVNAAPDTLSRGEVKSTLPLSRSLYETCCPLPFSRAFHLRRREKNTSEGTKTTVPSMKPGITL